MEKEQVISKLEEVFDKACEGYKERRIGSLTEIRELGETIIRVKQNVAHGLKQAERFIEQKIKMNASLSEKDIARIGEELKRLSVEFT